MIQLRKMEHLREFAHPTITNNYDVNSLIFLVFDVIIMY